MTIARILSVSFCLVVFCVCTSVSYAQTDNLLPWEPNVESSVRYKFMSEQLLQQPANFDFTTFRRHYAYSTGYAPLGEDLKDRLFELAYIIETTEDDTLAVAKALREYRDIVDQHLAHIGIVSMALSFSRNNHVFGDPKFYAYVQKALLDDILRSGDGTSLSRAYDVITLDGEIMLIGALRLGKVISTNETEGIVHYTMHDYVDEKSGRGRTIFVDTSFATKFLETQRKRRQRVIALP